MVLGFLAACSPVAVLNALAPTEGVRVVSDVAYRPGERHGLDIYASEQANAPVVVFLYGGGWQDGRKEKYRFVAAALAQQGVLTVIPDYRVYPDVRFPGFLFDAAEAVAWTKRNIARHGGDPNRLFVMGHSAGAHIAAMLTLDRQWLGRVGLDPDRDIAGMIGLAGPYDFLPLHDTELQAIFAPAGDLRLSQPISFARGDGPSMFLAAGMEDWIVLSGNTTRLADRIRDLGGRVEVHLYPNLGHAALIGAFSGALRWTAPVFQDVTAFLRANNRSTSDARVSALGNALDHRLEGRTSPSPTFPSPTFRSGSAGGTSPSPARAEALAHDPRLMPTDVTNASRADGLSNRPARPGPSMADSARHGVWP